MTIPRAPGERALDLGARSGILAAPVTAKPTGNGLTLAGVRKRFGETTVLKGIDLRAEPGELVVLVGPSGCGKSTLLRCLAGLETPDEGGIHIGDRDVTRLPPKERDIAMVFQSYALYPHMSVRENMGFSLKAAGVAKSDMDAKVDEAARVLKLEPLLDRRPKDLSGGQRQRVAIGRSIVRDPTAFLFDDFLAMHIRAKGLWDLDRAVGVLVVLENREQGASNREA